MNAMLPAMRMAPRPPVRRDSAGRLAFASLLALAFAAAVAATAAHAYAPALDMLPLCGGAGMALAAPRLAAAAAFTGMWTVMMAAMMLPSLAPALYRYRQSAAPAGGLRASLLALLGGAGYFSAWALLGAAVYPFELMRAALQAGQPMLAAAAPYATGAVLVLAGAVQCSAWKAGHLARCRRREPAALAAGAAGAWRHGWRLGRQCLCSCAGFTAVLLALGIMDLRVMAATAAAITIERLAPSGRRWAQAAGLVLMAAGLIWLTRAAWPA